MRATREGRYEDVRYQLSSLFPPILDLRGLRRGRRCGDNAGTLKDGMTDMMSSRSEFQFAMPRWEEMRFGWGAGGGRAGGGEEEGRL